MNSERPARVLIAVVLDQDEAALYWEKFEAALHAQVTTLLYDLLIVDVTPRAGPNYAGWLADVVRRWPRSRVRRLSAENPRDGLVASFSDHHFAVRAGQEAATELFGRWRSYDYLWLLRPDETPATNALQRAWMAGSLIAHDGAFEALLETEINRDETALERSLEGETIATVAATLRATGDAESLNPE